jgi:hypothetical protein
MKKITPKATKILEQYNMPSVTDLYFTAMNFPSVRPADALHLMMIHSPPIAHSHPKAFAGGFAPSAALVFIQLATALLFGPMGS